MLKQQVNYSNCYHHRSSPAGGLGWRMSIPWPRSALRAPSRWRTSFWCVPLSSSPSRGSPWRLLRTRRTSPSQNPRRSHTLSGDAAPPAVRRENEGGSLLIKFNQLICYSINRYNITEQISLTWLITIFPTISSWLNGYLVAGRAGLSPGQSSTHSQQTTLFMPVTYLRVYNYTQKNASFHELVNCTSIIKATRINIHIYNKVMFHCG